MSEPVPISFPEDILRWVAEQLDLAGEPFAVGRDIDLSPLYEGVIPGDEYQRRSEIEKRAAQRHWFTYPYGTGDEVRLTPEGAHHASTIYLTSRARTVLAESIARGIEADGPQFASGVASSKSEAMKAGGLGGNRYLLDLQRLVREALTRRADTVLSVWQEIAQAQGYSLSERDSEALEGSLRAALTDTVPELAEVFKRSPAFGPPLIHVGDRIRELITACMTATLPRVRRMTLGVGAPLPGPSHPVTNLTFTGSTIGAVQTGPGAAASVTQTVNQGMNAKEVLGLLAHLEAALAEHAADLSSDIRELIQDGIGETRAALAEPKPSRFRLRAAGLSFTELLQTVGSLPAVADVLVQLGQALHVLPK